MNANKGYFVEAIIGDPEARPLDSVGQWYRLAPDSDTALKLAFHDNKILDKLPTKSDLSLFTWIVREGETEVLRMRRQ